MSKTMKPNNPLVILICVFLCLMLSFNAAAAESPFKVVFTVPSGWTNEESIEVSIRVEELTEAELTKLEYKTGKDWADITQSYKNAADGRISVSVADNLTLKVRLTDSDGNQYTEEKKIDCFDRDAPNVKAAIDGGNLEIIVTDSLSGVAGVQVNGLLFTSVEGDSVIIPIADSLSRYERFAIRAFDYAGNFTDPVTVENTLYEKAAETVKTETAEKEESEEETTAAASSTAKTTVKTGSSSVYVMDKTSPTPTPVVETVVETVYETEYITLGPGMPFTSEGNAHTLDMLYSAATNKQFITLQTKAGNTFYLVIDYDKPIDEDAELYETYFLNLVDDRDLLALLTDEEKEELQGGDEEPTPTPQIIYITPEPTTVPVSTPVPAETEPEENKDSSQMTGILALVAILGIGGAAAFFLLKKKNNTAPRNLDNDFDLEDDEDETGESEA